MTVVTESSVELSRRSRFLAAIVGAGLLAGLLLASQLRPDPRGIGTHEQLGLPPCTFLTIVGIRCPACGMTTAWANVTHGRLLDAFKAHATGTVLAALALAVSGCAVAMAVRGRRLAWQPGETALAAMALAMTGLILCEWTIRLLAQ